MKQYFFRENDPAFGELTAAKASTTSLTASGSINFPHEWAEAGVAYKKSDATDWSFKNCESLTVDTTVSSLTSKATYSVALYVKSARGNVYMGEPSTVSLA